MSNLRKRGEYEVEEDPTSEYVFPEDAVEVLPEEPVQGYLVTDADAGDNVLDNVESEETAAEVIDITEDFDDRISVGLELREHYDKVKAHRDTVLDDPESEPKDINGALTATTALIKELSKIQESLFCSERFAVFQAVVISVLKGVDEDLRDKVMKELEMRLDRL